MKAYNDKPSRKDIAKRIEELFSNKEIRPPKYDMYDVVKALKRYVKLMNKLSPTNYKQEIKKINDMIKEISPGKYILD